MRRRFIVVIVAALAMTRRAALLALLFSPVGCTTVDPGQNFSPPNNVFDADFFYCHVEPEYLFAQKCGPGDPSKGDRTNGCHFNTALTGMQLIDHPAVNCGGGDHPVDRTQIGSGSPAQNNFEQASFEMNRQYMAAAIFVRPAGNNHPRPIFDSSDPQVNQVLSAWASR
jgi:hypothetical protein